jgi:hypothetical protein
MARALATLLIALAALVLAAACSGDGDFLLDENEEATGTPPFFQRSPAPSPQASPEGSPLAANATPVTPFQVTVDESVNLRESPSTQGGQETIVGTMNLGDKKTGIAKVRGEPIDDNDIWYQLSDGSFVWSGAVQEVEE